MFMIFLFACLFWRGVVFTLTTTFWSLTEALFKPTIAQEGNIVLSVATCAGGWLEVGCFLLPSHTCQVSSPTAWSGLSLRCSQGWGQLGREVIKLPACERAAAAREARRRSIEIINFLWGLLVLKWSHCPKKVLLWEGIDFRCCTWSGWNTIFFMAACAVLCFRCVTKTLLVTQHLVTQQYFELWPAGACPASRPALTPTVP